MPNVKLVIQQYIELPAGYTAGSIFSCIFNYQLGSNVQLVIQQYIKLPASAQCSASNSAIYSTTSWLFTAGSIFSYIFN